MMWLLPLFLLFGDAPGSQMEPGSRERRESGSEGLAASRRAERGQGLGPHPLPFQAFLASLHSPQKAHVVLSQSGPSAGRAPGQGSSCARGHRGSTLPRAPVQSLTRLWLEMGLRQQEGRSRTVAACWGSVPRSVPGLWRIFDSGPLPPDNGPQADLAPPHQAQGKMRSPRGVGG